MGAGGKHELSALRLGCTLTQQEKAATGAGKKQSQGRSFDTQLLLSVKAPPSTWNV